MSISVNRNALNHCVQQNAQVKALSATGRRICTSAGDISESSGPSLKNVADRLEVPILFIAYQGQRGIKKYASYGLNTDVEFSKLTRISDQACKDGAIVHPDIRSRQEFSLFAGCSKNDAAHFYVGVPIRDGKGPVIGSIAILQENQFVAVKGISLVKMIALGREFIAQSELYDEELHLQNGIKPPYNEEESVLTGTKLVA